MKAQDFFNKYGPMAVASMKATGVYASVTLAQAFIESGAGESGLTRKANNFFGIKGSGTLGHVMMKTREWSRARGNYFINAPFAAYRNAEESFIAHGQFFHKNPRYAKALAIKGNAENFAWAIQTAGYATDPNYATALIRVMRQYNLYQYDAQGVGQ